MNSPSIFALIPARSGSKSIPDKNIANLEGHPLIAYSIASAKMSKKISRVFVSTDSKLYADIAKSYGAEVPFLRPKEIASDDSLDREFFLHAMDWLTTNEKKGPDYWVHLRPTSPLRDSAVVDEAIQSFLTKPEATSLRSIHAAPGSPYKWLKKNSEGYLTGLHPDDKRPEYFNYPRQKFPDVYVPNGYVDIVKTSIMQKSEGIYGPRMMGFLTNSTIDIDQQEELLQSALRIKKEGSPLFDYLKSRSISQAATS